MREVALTPTLCVRSPSAIVRLVSSAGQVTISPVRKLSAVSPASSGSTPKTLCLRAQLLDRRGHAAQQSAAGDGRQHEVDLGQRLHDFQPAGRLPGDDLLVVVGRNHDIAVFAHQVFGNLASRSLEASPHSTTSAPKPSVAARLMAGAFDGITITAFAPTCRAA